MYPKKKVKGISICNHGNVWKNEIQTHTHTFCTITKAKKNCLFLIVPNKMYRTMEMNYNTDNLLRLVAVPSSVIKQTHESWTSNIKIKDSQQYYNL